MSHPSPYYGLITIRQHELAREAANWRIARSEKTTPKRGSSWALWRAFVGRLSQLQSTSANIGQLVHEATEERRQLRLIEVEGAEASGRVPDTDHEDAVIGTP